MGDGRRYACWHLSIFYAFPQEIATDLRPPRNDIFFNEKAAALSCGGKLLFVGLQQLSEVLDGADHLRNIGVLVVVPGNNLDLGLAVGHIRASFEAPPETVRLPITGFPIVSKTW